MEEIYQRAHKLFEEIKGPKDEKAKEAFMLAKQCAEREHCASQNLLGIFYRKGIGCKKNDEEAMFWYMQSAAQGNSVAEFNIGLFYKEKGQNLLAIEWFEKSVDYDDPKTIRCLLESYFDERNYCKMFEYLFFAKEKEDARCYYYFGRLFSSMKQCANCRSIHTPDYSQAFNYLLKAANCGDLLAQEGLAIFLDPSFPEECADENLKNASEAVKWYKVAAEKGSRMAQWNLHICYLDGDGVEKNETEVMKLLEILANCGNEFAEDKLYELATNLKDGDEKSKIEISEWYLSRAQKGETWAMCGYGKICDWLGRWAEALHWLHCAAVKGNKNALTTLSSTKPDNFVKMWNKEENFEILLYYVESVQLFLSAVAHAWSVKYKEEKFIQRFVLDYGLDWHYYYNLHPELAENRVEEFEEVELQHQELLNVYTSVRNSGLLPLDIVRIIFGYIPWFASIEDETKLTNKRIYLD